MAKKVEVVYAKPFKKALQDIDDMLKKQQIPEITKKDKSVLNATKASRDLVNAILDSANKDTCITKRQSELIQFLIMNSGFNIDVEHRDLLILCNSFRLDCSNCLNGDCGMRDPDAPVPKISEE